MVLEVLCVSLSEAYGTYSLVHVASGLMVCARLAACHLLVGLATLYMCIMVMLLVCFWWFGILGDCAKVFYICGSVFPREGESPGSTQKEASALLL